MPALALLCTRSTPRPLAALVAGSLALACLAAGSPAWAHPDQYRLVDSKTTMPTPDLQRTVTIVQAGSDPVNRFQMVRLAKRSWASGSRGTVFLLPPISSGFENYEVGENGDYAKSFAAYFASRDYDVWGVTQRTEELVAGSCESGAVDCSAMAGWGIQTLIDDATFVRSRIEDAHPCEKPAVGGVSLGSIAAVALIDAHPDDYAGAILQEGTLYDANPSERVIAQSFCTFYEQQLASGVYYDDQELDGLKMFAGLATTDPEAPTQAPGFPAGFTNHQAFVSVMSTPSTGPIPPRPNYYFLDGDAERDVFYTANDELARANIGRFVDYLALRTVRDLDCSMAGETTFTSNLARFRGPVFVNAGGHGFGQTMLDTLTLMPHARATVNFVESFGHMDHYFAVDHRQLMEEPILDWLQSDVFGH
jgi:pimeloyl-ACP methyl ester carboxylesterase